MKNTEIYALIGRVLSGEGDRQEQSLLQRWLEESEENRAVYENLRQVWDETTVKEQFSNADRVYQKIFEKRDSNSIKENKKRSISHWKRAGVAAVFILLGALSYLWLQKESVPAVQPENTTLVVKENPAGQKSKIVLTDGTIVWLNSESKISYPSGFNNTIRKIELVGEAYFQVAKDADRPFVVASGGLHTTAVGTAFNVQHYASDSVTTVFLAEGEVKVEDTERPGTLIYLKPGWGVSAAAGSAGLEKFADSADKWAGWKDGMLYFDNAGIQKVIKTCERWYSVEFSIKGTPPQDWKFNGRFKNENLKNVLESMRYGKDFDFSIENKNVELIFKN